MHAGPCVGNRFNLILCLKFRRLHDLKGQVGFKLCSGRGVFEGFFHLRCSEV